MDPATTASQLGSPSHDGPILDSAEQARRAGEVRRVRAASESSGACSSAEARALQDAWVRGEITGEQLVEQTRALQTRPRPRLL